MTSGIYRYEQGKNHYDTGTLVVQVTAKEKTLNLKIIEKDMRFSTYTDLLFGEKSKIRINLEKNPHGLKIFNDWFVIYPQRRGIPLAFVLTKEDT